MHIINLNQEWFVHYYLSIHNNFIDQTVTQLLLSGVGVVDVYTIIGIFRLRKNAVNLLREQTML